MLPTFLSLSVSQDDAVGGIRATSEAIDFFNEESNLVAKTRMLLAQALLYSKDHNHQDAETSLESGAEGDRERERER